MCVACFIPDSVFRISDEVSSALHDEKPVVALESAIITHGLPYPVNIECDIYFSCCFHISVINLLPFCTGCLGIMNLLQV